MDIKEKLELNKRIRKYEGTNGFILSLKKTLKGKFVERVEFEGKMREVTFFNRRINSISIKNDGEIIELVSR